MSDVEVTYSTVRFLKSPLEPRTRVRPEDTQPSLGAQDKECSVPWRLFAMAVGILCLLLVVTIALLVTHIFQRPQEKHQQQEILRNLHQKCNKQNDSDSKEQMLTNKSSEHDDPKHAKEQGSLSSDSNGCYRSNATLPKFLQINGKLFEKWLCCGVKCYYFTMKEQEWKRCKQTCQDSSLSLLKIDDNEELTLLKSQAHAHTYWTGFSHDWKENKWKWIDNGTSDLNLTAISLPTLRGKCLFLTSTRIDIIECDKTFYCICEKRMDK